MDFEERVGLVSRNTEEIITADELRAVMASKQSPRVYVGLEPSGLMHIGAGLVIGGKLKDFSDAGFEVYIFLADWHAYINDKFGADREKIAACARYFEDAFKALGLNGPNVKYIHGGELAARSDYWEKVLKVAKNSSVARIKRAMTIMGRKEDDAEADSSKLLYPSMQAADIFQMEVDVAYAGIDQRKVHMLAREVAEKLGWKKPVALHTPILTGLAGAQKMDITDAKMSKSNPDSCIFIHDSEDEIRRKLKKAFCPQAVADGNPVMDIFRHVIFPRTSTVIVERPEKHGGNLKIDSYDEMLKVYAANQLHPMDLKDCAARSLGSILEPVRKFFDAKPDNYMAVKGLVAGK